ncbi:MAG: GMC oxidoreductase, partial [Alphaproteobacteria bacterium]
IEVRHALKGVGENLRDHYPARLVAEVKGAKTVNEKVTGLPLVMEALRYAATRKGVLALSPTLVHCFWKSDEALSAGDLQLTFTPASYKEGVQSRLDDFPGVTVAAWQQRPESTGHVRARSADPFEKPEIQPNYLAHEIDRRCVLGGVKLARRLLATPELGRYVVRLHVLARFLLADDV